MSRLRLVHSNGSRFGETRVRQHRQRALEPANQIISDWLASDLDDPDQVYPELARRIAVALARRDAEISRLRGELNAASGDQTSAPGPSRKGKQGKGASTP